MRLTLLTFATALEVAELGLVSTMFPAMRAELDLAAGDLGILVAAGKLTAAVLSPSLVWLVGRCRPKVTVVAAACLAGMVTGAISLVGGFKALLALSCVLAVISGGLVPVTTALLADLFPDRQRGRAIGALYAAINLIGAVLATLLSQVSAAPWGWRVSYGLLGGLGLATGLATMKWFDGPAAGAARRTLVTPALMGSDTAELDLATRLRVFRIPTFNIMLLSRLLSGHLVIGSFGILFLTDVLHFPTPTAGLVLLPFGVGACAGNIGGAFVADRMHARDPRAGRVRFIQGAQFAFAIVAGLATQITWRGIEAYMAFWLILGFLQGVNPGVNRPIIMSVVRPELQPWAFAVMLSIVEPIGWAGYSYALSTFADGGRLPTGFLVILVGVMALNGLALTALYRTYPRDAAAARGDGCQGTG